MQSKVINATLLLCATFRATVAMLHLLPAVYIYGSSIVAYSIASNPAVTSSLRECRLRCIIPRRTESGTFSLRDHISSCAKVLTVAFSCIVLYSLHWLIGVQGQATQSLAAFETKRRVAKPAHSAACLYARSGLPPEMFQRNLFGEVWNNVPKTVLTVPKYGKK